MGFCAAHDTRLVRELSDVGHRFGEHVSRVEFPIHMIQPDEPLSCSVLAVGLTAFVRGTCFTIESEQYLILGTLTVPDGSN